MRTLALILRTLPRAASVCFPAVFGSIGIVYPIVSRGPASMSTIKHPYLLFLGDAADQLAAKTAAGVAFWRPEWCLGQLRLPGCKADLKLTDLSVEAAAAAGAKTLIV